MEPEIKKLIEQRKEKNGILFFIKPELDRQIGEFEIVKRKAFVGLNKNDTVLFEPIYDDIQFLTESICSLKIKNLLGLADCTSGEMLLDFNYARMTIDIEGYITTFNSEGRRGLYDYNNKKELLSCKYEEFGSPIGVEYIWIRNGNQYDYIEKKSGKIIRVGGLSRVYDSPEGMFGVNSSRRVIMIGEDGYENPKKLREIVMRAGGYLCLQNYVYKIEDYIDVYGNILNV